MIKLGYCYKHGIGVPQDYASAMQWYRMAADFDFNVGQYWVAVMYENGKGVKTDYVKVMCRYKKAAAQGTP